MRGRFALAGLGDVAPHPEIPGGLLDRDQRLGELRTEEEFEAVDQPVGRGKFVNRFVVVPQHHVQPRIRQRHPRELFGDVCEFCRGGFEELAADGRVEEEFADFDLRAGRAATGLERRHLSAVHLHLDAGELVGLAGAEAEAGDFADRRERLAAEPHRLHVEQVVGGGDFAGGVAGDGQGDVVGVDSFAVVDDADQLRSPLFDVDFDAGRQRVDRVFEQLLDHAGGAFDDLAGGDLVDHAGGELLNPGGGLR